MPNTRRRRFSVRDCEAAGRDTKLQNGMQSSHSDPDPELKVMTSNTAAAKSTKPKIKVYANSSKSSGVEIVPETATSSSGTSVKRRSHTTVDRDVTATSTNIDLYNFGSSTDDLVYCERSVSKSAATEYEIPKRRIETERRDEIPTSRERAPMRRDKHPHQHRIKVRSPKRRMAIIEQQNKVIEIDRRTTGTTPIDWGLEVEIFSVDDIANFIETTEDEEKISTHSFDDMCRICHGGESLSPELGPLISACSCRGTVGRVHVKCLERWLTESGKSRCELCGTRYATRRVHKYGVPRALVMWVLSHNAKQLMVDSLGIMLMSPLAVLAAWLSGRTLAGLMTQESAVTPWPLASTFVLACMTLCLYYREWILRQRRVGYRERGLNTVCYYCWIVSAATRHALGWWIWYRSQYEVRLQLQENEE